MVTPDGNAKKKKSSIFSRKTRQRGSPFIESHRRALLWPFMFEVFQSFFNVSSPSIWRSTHSPFTFRSLAEMWTCKYKSIFAVDLQSSKYIFNAVGLPSGTQGPFSWHWAASVGTERSCDWIHGRRMKLHLSGVASDTRKQQATAAQACKPVSGATY